MHPLLSFIILGSASFVYWDATKNKIGKIEGEKGIFNMSAGGWALASIYLWIITFPVYLSKRKDLIRKAKESPVEAPKRGLKLALLVAFCVLATGKNYQNQSKISKLKKSIQQTQSLSE